MLPDQNSTTADTAQIQQRSLHHERKEASRGTSFRARHCGPRWQHGPITQQLRDHTIGTSECFLRPKTSSRTST